MDINSKSDDLWTSLHCSAFNGHLSVVEYLVNHGAEINAKNNENLTPLHYSDSFGFQSVVEYLLIHGAEPLWVMY